MTPWIESSASPAETTYIGGSSPSSSVLISIALRRHSIHDVINRIGAAIKYPGLYLHRQAVKPSGILICRTMFRTDRRQQQLMQPRHIFLRSKLRYAASAVA